MKTLVFGSLNIDHVYQLDHFVQPGETIASSGYEKHAGGKGLNQAIALAKAGHETLFAGCIGQDGLFLKEMLECHGVNTDALSILYVPTGHALIQVDAAGENAIILFGGANRCQTEEHIDQALSLLHEGDLVLLQNEINLCPQIICKAAARGISVALNPSPLAAELLTWPLDKLSYLILNEIEGEGLTGEHDPPAILDALLARYPSCCVVLTLGEHGAWYADRAFRHFQHAFPATAVDTTAAGDTFTGYFLHAMLSGNSAPQALEKAAKAAAITVSRPGAAQSIPYSREVL